ncbi:MAG: HEAT repeat domain-containing protein, partial [Planctomycetota bacterium]
AEVMYRRALKKSPRDQAIRDQLQQLSEKRSGRSFGGGRIESAIAMADQATARPAASLVKPKKAEPIPAGELPKPSATVAAATSDSGQTSTTISTAAVSDLPNASSVQTASAVVADAAEITVTAGEILDVVEVPDQHRELLLKGLSHGDTAETRCLSATLLGDCATSDHSIRDALIGAAKSETNPQLLLSIADSQIQRQEATEATAECLIKLLSDSSLDVRIQACSELRYFAGTTSDSKCVAALSEALDSPDESVRSIAAVTLGDFHQLDRATADKLKQLSSSDSCLDVRDSASTAMTRIEKTPGRSAVRGRIGLDPRKNKV